MESIEKILNKKELITKDELIDFMVDYIFENNLDNYVDGITMKTGYNSYGMFFRYKKSININYDKLIIYLMNYFKNFNEKYYYAINTSIITTAIHELKHVEQLKITREFLKDPKIIKILKESYIKTNTPLYKTNHDDFIIEYNADIAAQFELIDILEKQNINRLIDTTEFLYYTLMNKFINRKEGVLSPLEYFLKLDNEFNYSNVYSEQFSNISELDKILYGLPLEGKNYQKILELRKQKHINFLNYFDK